ncbi:hypothetical protein BZG36_04025 [Bifiguratus adelaidae]|uniref:Arrestin C-terminal-like domain-containing protein n=1 Tax=Bifiguratus adelaidae TaxID=1938954 RepID=A0A261XYW0_9FUNG|nr:hypothetical protein BZG36_04025 [Bifiguratus adelaidae]
MRIKLRRPRSVAGASFFISLDEERYYFPGETLKGTVHLNLAKPAKVNALRVIFSGEVSINFKDKQAIPIFTEFRDVLRSDSRSPISSAVSSTYNIENSSLSSDDSGIALDRFKGIGPKLLEARAYTFPFEFRVPVDVPLPSHTQHFSEGSVSYYLRAWVDKSMTPPRLCPRTELSIPILERIDVSIPRFCLGSHTRVEIGFGNSLEDDSAIVTVEVPKNGFVRGEPIAVTVAIEHIFSLVKKKAVNIALCREARFSASQKNTRVNKRIIKHIDVDINIPGPTSLRQKFTEQILIPTHTPPTISTSLSGTFERAGRDSDTDSGLVMQHSKSISKNIEIRYQILVTVDLDDPQRLGILNSSKLARQMAEIPSAMLTHTEFKGTNAQRHVVVITIPITVGTWPFAALPIDDDEEDPMEIIDPFDSEGAGDWDNDGYEIDKENDGRVARSRGYSAPALGHTPSNVDRQRHSVSQIYNHSGENTRSVTPSWLSATSSARADMKRHSSVEGSTGYSSTAIPPGGRFDNEAFHKDLSDSGFSAPLRDSREEQTLGLLDVLNEGLPDASDEPSKTLANYSSQYQRVNGIRRVRTSYAPAPHPKKSHSLSDTSGGQANASDRSPTGTRRLRPPSITLPPRPLSDVFVQGPYHALHPGDSRHRSTIGHGPAGPNRSTLYGPQFGEVAPERAVPMVTATTTLIREGSRSDLASQSIGDGSGSSFNRTLTFDYMAPTTPDMLLQPITPTATLEPVPSPSAEAIVGSGFKIGLMLRSEDNPYFDLEAAGKSIATTTLPASHRTIPIPSPLQEAPEVEEKEQVSSDSALSGLPDVMAAVQISEKERSFTHPTSSDDEFSGSDMDDPIVIAARRSKGRIRS